MKASLFLVALLALSCACADVSARRAGRVVDRPHPRLSMPEVNRDNIDAALGEWRSQASPNGGVFGVDVSNAYGANQWQCLRGQGYSFAIVRAWRSLCIFDANAVATIQAAWDGGMQAVDTYLFPAFKCNLTASEQVSNTIAGLQGSKYGLLWLDIESEGSAWGEQGANLAWIREAVQTASSLIGRERVGVYTNRRNWATVVGESDEFADLPVWYAHYDNNASFDDWNDFGGWTKPAIKQFADGPTICGMILDHNWQPM